jgi:hypothetical protein
MPRERENRESAVGRKYVVMNRERAALVRVVESVVS